jgi:catalase
MAADAALGPQILDVLDTLAGGIHPGFRSVHAKGVMCAGNFTPSPQAAGLTRAPHAGRPSTPVTLRLSGASGLPTGPDNDPAVSGPRGIAVRFHLGEHVHTDIIGHSANSFPARTGQEFLEFIRAVVAAVGAGKPEALREFLATHPGAKRHVELPKPIPTSFARENYFAMTAFKFTNAAGRSWHGRFRIRPGEGTEYLSNEAAAAKSPDFLADELAARLARGPFRLVVFVQLAGSGDDVTDASTPWPESREEIAFGTITVTERVDDQTPERRKMIFDPLPRVDGIDSSGDPLTDLRSDVYLLSGRRRRMAAGP